MKGVTRVIRTRGTHRRPREWNIPLLALGPTLKWPWRVFSVVMMGLLGGFLLAPGAALAKTETSLNVVVLGDPFSFGYATSANAALREAAPPTLAALNQIQTANPGVQLNVVFIPLKDASTPALNHPAGTGAFTGQSPLIKSVSQASIVIVGLGAGNASLAAPMRSVLFSPSASQPAFTQLMTAFDNGSYLRSQSALLAEVAADTAPGTAVITLGYPNVKAQQHGSSLALWSPYSWTMISQQQANMSDQLVSALNTSNQLATSIASVQHPKLRFVFANLSGAAQAAGSASSQDRSSKAKGHASASLSQSASPTLIGGALLPVFDQAVNNELATKGVLGAQKVSAVTSKSPWNLTVLVPLASQPPQQAQPQQQGQSQQQQAQPQHGWSNAGVNAPAVPKPPAFQPPALLPAAPPSVPLLPLPGGSGDNGQSAPSQGSPQGSTGHHHSGPPSGQPQPAPTTTQSAGTGQQKPPSQSAPSTSPSAAPGQQAGVPGSQTGSAGQTTASQLSPAAQPNGSSQPAPTQPAPSTPSPQQPGTPTSGNLPVLPTPPAPIPEPIAPAQRPGVGGLAPGTGTNPSDSTTPQAPTTLPMIPAAPGTPTTTGAAPATPSAPGAATAPASPSAAGTTTPATTSANGATVPATTTSANGATLPATTTSANGATVPATTTSANGATVPATRSAAGTTTPATTPVNGATTPATTSAAASTTPATTSASATTIPASASGGATTTAGSASGAATASTGSASGGATA